MVHFKNKAFTTQLHRSPAQNQELQSTDCNGGLGAFLVCFCYFSLIFFFLTLRSYRPFGVPTPYHPGVRFYLSKTHREETELSQTAPWRARRTPEQGFFSMAINPTTLPGAARAAVPARSHSPATPEHIQDAVSRQGEGSCEAPDGHGCAFSGSSSRCPFPDGCAGRGHPQREVHVVCLGEGNTHSEQIHDSQL